MQRLFITSGTALMALAVALGAFGAHGLRQSLEPAMLTAWHTGVQYHVYHALGLLVLGALYRHLPQAGARAIGLLMLTGIVLFSGSLYLMALTGLRWLGAITPLGGTAFIIAWLMFTWIAWKGLKAS
ncbi:MAG: DUF423 domain-containing protein [Thioalkalivibrio sp.]